MLLDDIGSTGIIIGKTTKQRGLGGDDDDDDVVVVEEEEDDTVAVGTTGSNKSHTASIDIVPCT